MRSVVLQRGDGYTSWNIHIREQLTNISPRGISFVAGLSNTEFEKVTQALEKESVNGIDIYGGARTDYDIA